jgi:hypothetical protein
MHINKALIASVILARANCLKIGLLSDIHTLPIYDQGVSADNQCVASASDEATVLAPLGRYGCDPSEALIRTMLQHFRDAFGRPDVLLIAGDHFAHYYSDWEATKQVLGITNDLVKEFFSDTWVLIAVGNNDTEAHD